MALFKNFFIPEISIFRMNFRGTSKYQKFSERMEKKTHFSRTEIDRLTDLHRTTMVSKNLSDYAFSKFIFSERR